MILRIARFRGARVGAGSQCWGLNGIEEMDAASIGL